MLWSALQARHNFFQPSSPLGFVIDYLVNVVAILLSFTIYSKSPVLLIILLAAPIALIYMVPGSTGSRKKPKVPPTATSKGDTQATTSPLSAKPFLTTYRACMMIATVVAILAVDFRIFPRRFAKVETWGTSLMDLGVGSFVFAAGIVGARPVLKEKAAGRVKPLGKRLLESFRHSIPLLVLGFIRFLSVKGLDYAEHVTEYGVHWNFFFTLGFLPPFVAIFREVLRLIPSHAVLALVVSGVYEAVLDNTSLKAYVLTAPRVDLLSKNREGIFSFIGYLAIFLAGQDLGMFVIPRTVNPRSKERAGVQRNTLLMTMGVWSAIWTVLFVATTHHSYGLGLDVSRRMANLPYVLGVAAFNSLQLLAFAIVDTIFFPAFYNAADEKSEKEAYNYAISHVFRAYNRNGLFIFLIANLLTGLVNITVPTLDVTPPIAMAVLVVYTGTVTAVALALDAFNISIKL